MVYIRSFCWLKNECLFCTCKQHSYCIPELQGIHFLSYLLFYYFIFLSFQTVFPPMTCLKILFFKKNNMLELKKFSLEPYFSLRWTSVFELFVLSWEVCGYMLLSVVILGISVLFFVLSILIFLDV